MKRTHTQAAAAAAAPAVEPDRQLVLVPKSRAPLSMRPFDFLPSATPNGPLRDVPDKLVQRGCSLLYGVVDDCYPLIYSFMSYSEHVALASTCKFLFLSQHHSPRLSGDWRKKIVGHVRHGRSFSWGYMVALVKQFLMALTRLDQAGLWWVCGGNVGLLKLEIDGPRSGNLTFTVRSSLATDHAFGAEFGKVRITQSFSFHTDTQRWTTNAAHDEALVRAAMTSIVQWTKKKKAKVVAEQKERNATPRAERQAMTQTRNKARESRRSANDQISALFHRPPSHYTMDMRMVRGLRAAAQHVEDAIRFEKELDALEHREYVRVLQRTAGAGAGAGPGADSGDAVDAVDVDDEASSAQSDDEGDDDASSAQSDDEGDDEGDGKSDDLTLL